MNTKLFLTTMAGGIAASALLVAAPASAATFTFTDGAPAPSAGYGVIDHFDDLTGVTCNVATLCQIKTPPSDGNGAPPANSSPSGTAYLSVLGGGIGTYTFAAATTAFQFDWGSVDTYNTLTVNGSAGPIIITGTNITNPANGDQTAPGTNGLFTIVGGVGETFTSFSLASSSNSFEIDNLAVPVTVQQTGTPEPATWAMMIMGFGMAGGMMRARRRAAATA